MNTKTCASRHPSAINITIILLFVPQVGNKMLKSPNDSMWAYVCSGGPVKNHSRYTEKNDPGRFIWKSFSPFKMARLQATKNGSRWIVGWQACKFLKIDRDSPMCMVQWMDRFHFVAENPWKRHQMAKQPKLTCRKRESHLSIQSAEKKSHLSIQSMRGNMKVTFPYAHDN